MNKYKQSENLSFTFSYIILFIIMAISFFAIIHLTSCTLNVDGAGNKSLTLPVEDAEFLSHLIRGDK